MKRRDKLQKQLKETQEYDVKLGYIALYRVDIALEDGVKVNYEKVQTGRDGKKMQFLTKI
ncbi:MAG: BREX-1 system adenine-specific DNA-methyltransferase PglX [Lachnospiraceae bacterium]|nr:BREX-1 system adenine-specific DNA-methyltransferase PglX [Lachnospiraceae bacterium]